MKYVSPLSSEIESMLHEAVSGCPHQRVRQRAQAILWSAMGYSRRDIADLSFVVPIVVSHWLNHWEKAGLSGLYDAPRSGRPPIYTAVEGAHLKSFIDDSPQQLRQAHSQLIELTGKSSSLDTAKRLLKKNTNYGWKRCRCTVGKEPDAQVFAEEHVLLATLNSSEAKAKGWELYYFDESGFSLHPVVPYAWQPKGQTIRIPSTASPRLNVLGFFSKTQPAFFQQTEKQSIVRLLLPPSMHLLNNKMMQKHGV